MTKWYQSTGIYRSPLFKNPSYPNNLPAKSTKEKRELLVVELLTSKVEASDIPPDILTITTRYIDFLSITANNVRKAVIEAGNTVPGVDKVLIAIL